MAGAAVLRGGFMVCGFSRGDDAIVAACTQPKHLRVVDLCGWPEANCGMAGLAEVCGRGMQRRTARGNDTVVASGTNAQHFVVVYSYNGSPGGGEMAGAAILGG